jgi:hypothetical protein
VYAEEVIRLLDAFRLRRPAVHLAGASLPAVLAGVAERIVRQTEGEKAGFKAGGFG